MCRYDIEYSCGCYTACRLPLDVSDQGRVGGDHPHLQCTHLSRGFKSDWGFKGAGGLESAGGRKITPGGLQSIRELENVPIGGGTSWSLEIRRFCDGLAWSGHAGEFHIAVRFVKLLHHRERRRRKILECSNTLSQSYREKGALLEARLDQLDLTARNLGSGIFLSHTEGAMLTILLTYNTHLHSLYSS